MSNAPQRVHDLSTSEGCLREALRFEALSWAIQSVDRKRFCERESAWYLSQAAALEAEGL